MVYTLGDPADTSVMIAEVAPGAVVPVHAHDEHQIGLCLRGRFVMEVDGRDHPMPALERAYFAPGGTPHGARNESGTTAVTVDIKRKPIPSEEGQLTRGASGTVVLPLTEARAVKGGLAVSFFVGPWFEIMLSHLAPGAVMPLHTHRGSQIGIGVAGTYTMRVGDEVRTFGPEAVYHAPDHVPHSGWNDEGPAASSLNVFIPPRWNLRPKRERA
ncbi:Cupin domain protein [Methylobacterium sp. ap11]|uniref:cupin domain-containing protein n=1 Tax=Methylobacterium sp. ap11 TaxID=1761799 RepID=UPI0008D3FF78|nr:cupin domain-containing protein [Methylobacterium sp. ap11]SEO37291.1 Cupin domain protein [Methylobacterium sp. ap11]